ncbi:MAG: SusC/RagA family TonB-linked outer membrane protein [Bacteroidales bacterium]|jgi:TonB-linked SusC/RagA family outer membrane protein|nr:SusC/RagA family TonB-linked outer membrane protein [Bacteroidales bacterium]MCI2121689.1 SusC/RagA family TonB-linked outer membrane protein [Bacteroidales bacterium]MCI2144886.1 SusC/RagA family TonB-linked outer membrane protein [Bacteroidales bacterium]
MRFKFVTVLAVSVLFNSAFCLAQPEKVTGVVTGKEDGLPVIQAAVMVKGYPAKGTVTDLDGVYSIQVSQGDTLEFSCTGMKSVLVPVSGRTVIDVIMEYSTEAIDDVIVVAYGTAKKESFTGSAEVVSHDKMKNRPVTDISKMLDGQVAGVMTTSGSGQPGSGASVVIRGFGSINASNSPLVVVDGMPFDGDLNSISSNDIETMTVLKDASAGALYGARGANGVLIITTKKNKKSERLNMSFSSKIGISARAIPSYSTLNAKEYMEVMYNAAYNDLVSVEGYLPATAKSKTVSRLENLILGTDDKYNCFDRNASELFNENGKVVSDAKQLWNQDWIKEAEASAPLRQEYELSIDGSAAKTTYSASLGYLNENGTLKTTDFKRYTGRMNMDFTPNDHFVIGLNYSYSHTDSDFLGATGSTNSNVWYSAMMMAPIYPVYQTSADGTIAVDPDTGEKLFDYGSSRPAGAQNNRNSVAVLFDDKYFTYSDINNLRTYAGLNFGDFKFRVNLGVDNSNSYETTYYNPYYGNAAGTGRLRKENGRVFSYTLNELLTYGHKWGKHSFDALAGHEFYSYTYNYLMGEKTGFPFPDYYELATGTTISDTNSAQDEYAIDSYLSRVNYNYDDRYYLSASFRTDASSRFKKENRWGIFWSLGASWRISEEGFLKDKDWIDNLTLKASYGLQGNDNLGVYYAWQSYYDLSYPNATYSGGVVSNIENDDVTWEKNGNLNIGIEFKFLNRIWGTLEMYDRTTYDLLLYYPMAISTGFEGYNANVGSISNIGADFTIGATIVKIGDFQWNATLIASTLKNKVLRLTSDGSDILDGNYIIRVGEELNSFYLARSAGVDPATGEQLYYAYEKDNEGKMIPGSEYVTSDATVAANSKYLLGSRIPDLYGSINTSLSYKGFDLNVMGTYSIGGKIYDGVYRSIMEPSFVGQTYSTDILRSWKQAGDMTDVPRVTTTSSTIANDRYLVDASFFSIRSIALGYTYASSKLFKAGMEQVRIFLTADSPFLFASRKGLNPQASFTGSTGYTYSPSKSLTLGVDIKF